MFFDLVLLTITISFLYSFYFSMYDDLNFPLEKILFLFYTKKYREKIFSCERIRAPMILRTKIAQVFFRFTGKVKFMHGEQVMTNQK